MTEKIVTPTYPNTSFTAMRSSPTVHTMKITMNVPFKMVIIVFTGLYEYSFGLYIRNAT